jgi:hypothetical protein
MAIKDKVKKAAQAIKKEIPSTSSSTANASQPTTTSTSATTTTKAEPAPAAKVSAPTSIAMPKSNGQHATNGNGNGSTNGVKTPKTPQDEAIAFFSSGSDGAPVQVWELWLEDDGGPDESKSVCPSLPCEMQTGLIGSMFDYPLLSDLMY